MMLAGLLCLALGASRLLARYHIVAAGHSTVVAGASFVDVNFLIPAYNFMVVCWLATALILMIAVLKPQFRVRLLSRRSHWLIPSAALAILFIGSFAVPAAIEAFYVGPNQITLEMPFLVIFSTPIRHRQIIPTANPIKVRCRRTADRIICVTQSKL
jgi:uncharacterized membrane protein (UPF0182 family)